jgi:xanthine dehydrogenase accessory factor
MNMNWIEAAHQLNRKGEAHVMVTLVGVTGSTPRDSGTKMVVTQENLFDTIGGGHLEHKCLGHAQQMLKDKQSGQHLEHFQLAVKLGQCCGGTATVLFEYFASSTVNIMLFGAGHVGQALIGILADLPCKVTWVDSREEQFPAQYFMRSLSNVTAVVSENPVDEIANMPANSYYIVMTHNHQLDFDICQNILQADEFNYLGLIASQTKWRRFKQRFGHRDIDPAKVARMSCPIGSAEVPGKKPMEIAVSIAAEIIARYHGQSTDSKDKSVDGVHWDEFKQLLTTS